MAKYWEADVHELGLHETLQRWVDSNVGEALREYLDDLVMLVNHDEPPEKAGKDITLCAFSTDDVQREFSLAEILDAIIEIRGAEELDSMVAQAKARAAALP